MIDLDVLLPDNLLKGVLLQLELRTPLLFLDVKLLLQHLY
jgi:hypothetical protein